LISLNKINFSFGGRSLFENASLQIVPGQKCGLIGANGCGKTTLLKIILGEYTIDSGSVNIQRGIRVGHLHQEVLVGNLDQTAFDNAFSAFEELNEIESRIRSLESEMQTQHDVEYLDELAELRFRLEMIDGNKARAQTAKILSGLGFSEEQMNAPLSDLSGGWRMRTVLARMLLQNNDILLLDEPTNHLDLPTIMWMEQYMKDYEGAYLVISHDRFFLDKVSESIIEIENNDFNEYTGNYSDFELQKNERMEILLAQKVNQDKYIKTQERFIERFRAKNTKATAVQSRIKKLNKLDRIELEQSEDRSLNVQLEFDQQPGNVVMDVNIKDKSYGDLKVIANTTLKVSRGDKIALIGPNGFGKSTLLRILNNKEPYIGKVEFGYNVSHSYYAQHQVESLTLKNNILEELQQTAPDKNDTFLRSLAGSLLFHNDDVFKKIKVLSGGEKARVALAKTILNRANFLLLDEPNNHLDLHAVKSLAESLGSYKGTLVLVSHDRYFISLIANKIWYIEDKVIKEYPGTYDEFQRWYDKKDLDSSQAGSHSENDQTDTDSKTKYLVQKELKRELQKKKNDLEKLGKKKEKYEKLRNEVLHQLTMEENYTNHEKLKELQSLEHNYKTELKNATEEWENLFLKIMELEEQQSS